MVRVREKNQSCQGERERERESCGVCAMWNKQPLVVAIFDLSFLTKKFQWTYFLRIWKQ